MVDSLVDDGYIQNSYIERAFRSINRGWFYPDYAKNDAYNPSTAWRAKPTDPWPVHLSAPNIYATVMEALSFEKGQSFLNVGSGTGYLSSLCGCMIGMINQHFKEGVTSGSVFACTTRLVPGASGTKYK
uniref:Protein-L-isoaspartate O-methyltransferase n=1 Tax=Acrobeloides nanus TaxID=290746 RepID=A0A914C288_9BILA